MKRFLAFVALIAFIVAPALAHGKSHHLLGTVKTLHENHLVLTTTDNKEATVMLLPDTRYERDGKATDRSALVPGTRVSVELNEKHEAAVLIKIGAATASHAH